MCIRDSLRLANELLDEVLGFLTNLVPLFAIEVKLTFGYHLQNLLVIIAIERRITAKQNVEDAASGPHVTLYTIISGEDLG